MKFSLQIPTYINSMTQIIPNINQLQNQLIVTKPMDTMVVTVTFGDVSENHVGMQQNGVKSDTGFTLQDLTTAKELFEHNGAKCELIDLVKASCTDIIPQHNRDLIQKSPAYVLVVRQGVKTLLGPDNVDPLYIEQKQLNWDCKAYMRGKVVNKHARYNLCYDDVAQEPDYDNKKGRIIDWKSILYLGAVNMALPNWFGPKAAHLKAEGNCYYDVNKCGIGFHGDNERKKVIALRLGANMPLHFRWYYQGEIISDTVKIMLHHSDMYMMCQKAVGTDWKRRVIPTLRHAAGCDKYLQ
jgi:hypothetical protein